MKSLVNNCLTRAVSDKIWSNLIGKQIAHQQGRFYPCWQLTAAAWNWRRDVAAPHTSEYWCEGSPDQILDPKYKQ